jgi:two-component system NtrC family sensor kinase
VRGTVSGRSALERRAVHVADLQAEGFPEGSAPARELGFRAVLVVPLLSEGTVIGTIGLRRTEANPFTHRQVALLQTFADQAVIAIENVRLFTELQEKNRALTTAHAQVTESLLRAPTTSATQSTEPAFHFRSTLTRTTAKPCAIERRSIAPTPTAILDCPKRSTPALVSAATEAWW